MIYIVILQYNLWDLQNQKFALVNLASGSERNIILLKFQQLFHLTFLFIKSVSNFRIVLIL
jgi:hypothetical protein